MFMRARALVGIEPSQGWNQIMDVSYQHVTARLSRLMSAEYRAQAAKGDDCIASGQGGDMYRQTFTTTTSQPHQIPSRN